MLPISSKIYKTPSNRALWRAYFWAPAVAPFAFVAILLIVSLLAHLVGFELNPARILLLPLFALTIGIVTSYLVAGVVGMPIAFYLRRNQVLNGYSIHGAAFCWAAFFTGVCAVVMVGENWNALPLCIFYFGLGVIPPVLLSGTAFWLLVQYFSESEAHNATRT